MADKAANPDVKRANDALDLIDTATSEMSVDLNKVNDELQSLLGQIAQAPTTEETQALAVKASVVANKITVFAAALDAIAQDPNNPVPAPEPDPEPVVESTGDASGTAGATS